jgi:hypothetical protein
MKPKNLSTDLYGILLRNLVLPCLNPENLFDFAVDILFCSKLWVKFSPLLGAAPQPPSGKWKVDSGQLFQFEVFVFFMGTAERSNQNNSQLSTIHYQLAAAKRRRQRRRIARKS